MGRRIVDEVGGNAMNTTKVEQIYELITSTAKIIQDELGGTELEAIAETGENLFQGDVLQDELSEITVKKLKKSYQEIHLEQYSKEDIRKGWQLAILKAMRTHVQPNHQMTPDAIGFMFAYLLEKFTAKQEALSVLDPAVGTGNLLFSVMNVLTGKQLSATGIEVDETLVKLAYTGANLLGMPVHFLHQDSLQPLFIDPADVVICDLPIGYYPDNERAKDFKVRAKDSDSMSYAHHLFIEQGFTYSKDGGYLFFLVPNDLFTTSEAPALNQFIHEHGYIQGLIQLPESMFKSKQSAKSILILQKTGEGVKAPKQVLLVNMPKLSDKNATAAMLNKIDNWIKAEK